MKILVFTHYFWPEEFRINDCVSTLVERGHDVTVICGAPSYPKGEVFAQYRADPARFQNYCGARIVRIPVMTRGRGGGARLMLNYLSAALSASTIGLWRVRDQAFDAILVFQPSPITTALPAVLRKWMTRTPVTIWVQDLWPETLQAVGMIRSPKVLGLVTALVRFIYRACDHILVQSKGFEAAVRKHAPAGARVSYLPNWSDPAFADETAMEAAPELSAFSDTLNIMFAGNLGEAQDLPTVIEAADRCRDIEDLRWLIVGDGSAREAAQAMMESRGLQDRVIFLGRHPSTRMPAFFKAADVMLLSLRPDPIFSLTIPSKLQSYMMSGRPVLSMVDGEAADLVREADCGITVAAGDADGLASAARAMRSLAPAERDAMGRRGRAYGLEAFDRDRLISRLELWLAEAARPR